MDELEQLLRDAGLLDFLEKLREEGVECVADVGEYFNLDDLKALGMNTVQAKRMLRMRARATNSCGATSSSEGTMMQSHTNAPESTEMLDLLQNNSSCGGTTSIAETANQESIASQANAENVADCSSGRTTQNTRIVVSRPKLAPARSRGNARCKSWGNVAANGACCSEFLEALEAKLLPAKRTEREKNRTSGSKTVYHYARLQAELIFHAFDALGNFNCHATCLAARLRLSSAVVSRIHLKAIERAQSPTQDMDVQTIVHRGIENRALLPEVDANRAR